MGTRLHEGASEETEIASDLRIGSREFDRAKQQSRGQEASARISATQKECALGRSQVAKLRVPQTGGDTRGVPKKWRFGGDVCGIAQKIRSGCTLHSAE